MDFSKLIAKSRENLVKIKELCTSLLFKPVSIMGSLFKGSLFKKNKSRRDAAPSSEPELSESQVRHEQQASGLTRTTEKLSLLMRFCGSSLKNIREIVSSFMLSFENRFLQRFPEKQRRPILYGVGGMALLFVILLIYIPVSLSGGRPQQATAPRTAGGFAIPSEELFFPAEPDFFPQFMLEREPRGYWTLEDIRPYWRIPQDTDLFRQQIKSAVDRLMEGVR